MKITVAGNFTVLIPAAAFDRIKINAFEDELQLVVTNLQRSGVGGIARQLKRALLQ
jgi:hypothetical protein